MEYPCGRGNFRIDSGRHLIDPEPPLRGELFVITISDDWREIPFESLLSIYQELNWAHYAQNPEGTRTAFENSTKIFVASDGRKPIGLVRSLSDSVSIHYIQDILVLPEYQRKGVGKALLKEALKAFCSVRTHILLTDDEERQKTFYQSLGFKSIKELKTVVLNTFVKIEGVDLN
jgi:ribosomal protein S18 acetylase RimI-like enzyme